MTRKHCSTFYTVDGERQESREHELTVEEILRQAGLDPDERCLIEICGKDRHSYKDRAGHRVRLRDGLKFVTVFCGPVPVS